MLGSESFALRAREEAKGFLAAEKPALRLSFRLASEPSANFSKKTPLSSHPPTRFASQTSVFALSPTPVGEPPRSTSSRSLKNIYPVCHDVKHPKGYLGGNVPPFRLRGLASTLRACDYVLSRSRFHAVRPSQASQPRYSYNAFFIFLNMLFPEKNKISILTFS